MDSSETERLKQANQQLKDEVKQLNQKLDDLQQIMMEQMKVIIETLVEDGNDIEVLELGFSVITLNLGMYIADPAAVSIYTYKFLKLRK